MKLIWRNLINLTLITSICVGCAGIPGKNVKLENYPKVDQSNLAKLDLSYDKTDSKLSEVGVGDFTNKIVDKLYFFQINREKNPSKRCHIKVSSNHDYGTSKICQAYGILTGFTLFIVPAYCYWNYQANASLISYPQDSQIHGTIKTSIREAKLGDIFLDENDRPAKLLKTYELKDKVHEYWSLVALLGEITVAIISPSTINNSNISTPERAKLDTENTISEALVRQVIHDASTFEECKKSILTN